MLHSGSGISAYDRRVGSVARWYLRLPAPLNLQILRLSHLAHSDIPVSRLDTGCTRQYKGHSIYRADGGAAMLFIALADGKGENGSKA